MNNKKVLSHIDLQWSSKSTKMYGAWPQDPLAWNYGGSYAVAEVFWSLEMLKYLLL